MRVARESLGISLEELAQRAGVSARTVRRWEADTHSMRLDQLPEVAAALEVSRGWLAFGQGDGPAEDAAA